jgi:hypothetical protein
LGNEGVVELSEGLLCNKSLIMLNLSHNEISALGVEVLVKTLKKTNITEIDLSRNTLGNTGI